MKKIVKEFLNEDTDISNGDLFLESLWRKYSRGQKKFELSVEEMHPDNFRTPGKTNYIIKYHLKPLEKKWEKTPPLRDQEGNIVSDWRDEAVQ